MEKNIYVALENIRSLHNVGAIFRTCSFFGFNKVLLVGYTGKVTLPSGKEILNNRLTKTSLGSEQDLILEFLSTSQELLNFSKKANLPIFSIEQHENAVMLADFIVEKSILVFGNEKTGVSEFILRNSSKIVEIEKIGKHNSLNVTTSCGIVLHHLSKITS